MLMNLLVLLLTLGPVQAYNQGNKLYVQKDYAGAAQAYEQALGAGPNAAAHYNLGNALFKQGTIGRAILNYRRAYFLAPRDADIATNLEFARNYRVDKLPGSISPVARVLEYVFRRLSLPEAAWLAALCFALAGLCLALWIVNRWAASMVAASLAAAIALFAFVTQQVWNSELSDHPGVVVVSEVNALSGPSDEAKQILLLHDGTEVRIREARGDYLLVQLPGGAGGWIRKETIERVY